MKKLLIISGSNSRKSINMKLARHAGTQIKESEMVVMDLNDYEMPIYSPMREESGGIPDLAKKFVKEIESSDGIVISMPEHNGSYPAAFKNIYDWTSRHNGKLWSEKPMLLLSTSPGGRGGATVMAAAKQTFPRMGAQLAATFSLGSFYDNFSEESGVKDEALRIEFDKAIEEFSIALK
ncbi:NAD(P)H-dependent oxidoreductase [Bdellovibrionales bacterium]|nr:NAD(P)H-dependent oxidoreductase [Bdellovibrionales bacterium]